MSGLGEWNVMTSCNVWIRGVECNGMLSCLV